MNAELQAVMDAAWKVVYGARGNLELLAVTTYGGEPGTSGTKTVRYPVLDDLESTLQAYAKAEPPGALEGGGQVVEFSRRMGDVVKIDAPGHRAHNQLATVCGMRLWGNGRQSFQVQWGEGYKMDACEFSAASELVSVTAPEPEGQRPIPPPPMSPEYTKWKDHGPDAGGRQVDQITFDLVAAAEGVLECGEPQGSSEYNDARTILRLACSQFGRAYPPPPNETTTKGPGSVDTPPPPGLLHRLVSTAADTAHCGCDGDGEQRAAHQRLTDAVHAYLEAETPTTTGPEPDIMCSKCGAPAKYTFDGSFADCPCQSEPVIGIDPVAPLPHPTILQLEKGDVCVVIVGGVHREQWPILYQQWKAMFPGVEIRIQEHSVQVLRPAKGGEDGVR